MKIVVNKCSEGVCTHVSKPASAEPVKQTEANQHLHQLIQAAGHIVFVH